MNDLKQIDIKVFAEDASDVKATEFVAVLQRWIREHTVPGTLIDVADYSHIHNGAGVILVGHEYNLSVDYGDGRMGLLVHYKLPAEDSLEERIASAMKLAFNACSILEEEGEFKARLKFSRTDFRFLASDRLHAPNTDDVYAQVAPALEAAAKDLPAGNVALNRVNDNPADRLAVDVTISGIEARTGG
ncbi:MAG: hypothetical protein QGD90_11670 [Candidatus Hydrogenedentes bacterium]|nr:hypothetical protein [Candidatus Hydrogenedentota bacterium]